MRRILITGGAGYIGSILSKKLLDKKYQVRVIDNLMYGKEPLNEVLTDPNFELVVADIRDKDKLRAALKDVYGIVHLACIVGDPACQKQPELAKSTNYDASVQLLDLSQKNNAQRFVFASTCSNYGKMKDPNSFVAEDSPLNPVSLYAQLKVDFENHMLNGEYSKDFTVTGLRFATAYGLSPRIRFDLTVNEFTKELALGRELVVFGEQFWRPYCHVNDLAEACIRALEADHNIVHKNVYNVGDTDENYSKKMIVELLQGRLPQGKVKYVHKNEDPRDYRVNFSKIKKELDFKVSKKVNDGIEEILDLILSGSLPDPDSQKYRNI